MNFTVFHRVLEAVRPAGKWRENIAPAGDCHGQSDMAPVLNARRGGRWAPLGPSCILSRPWGGLRSDQGTESASGGGAQGPVREPATDLPSRRPRSDCLLGPQARLRRGQGPNLRVADDGRANSPPSKVGYRQRATGACPES